MSDGPSGNPFPGPRSYDAGGYFFGREADVSVVRSLVLSNKAVVLYAASGAGKTSLLRAGVIPSLQRFGMEVLPAIRFRELQSARRASGQQVDVPATFSDIAGSFLAASLGGQHDSSSEGAVTSLRAATKDVTATQSRGAVIVLDQFEDLFASPELWRARDPFFKDLAEAIDNNDALRVIISIRSDFLASMVAYERMLPGGAVARYQLENLTGKGARRAIERSFDETGLPLAETSLDRLEVSLLTRQLADHDEPVLVQYVNLVQLQIMCRRLWEVLAAKPVPDAVEPDRLAIPDGFDLAESVVDFVDAAVLAAAGPAPSAQSELRRWLEVELVLPDGRRNLRRRDRRDTVGMPNTIVDALEVQRLVHTVDRDGDRWIELTHDSLVTALQRSNDRWRARGAVRPISRGLRVAGALLLSTLAILAAFVILKQPVEASPVLAVGALSGNEPTRIELRPDLDGMLIVRFPASLAGEGTSGQLRRVDGDEETAVGPPLAGPGPFLWSVKRGDDYVLSLDGATAGGGSIPYEVQFAETVAHEILTGQTDEDVASGLRLEVAEDTAFLGLDVRPGEAYLVDADSYVGAVVGANVAWQDVDRVLIVIGPTTGSEHTAVPVAVEITERDVFGDGVTVTRLEEPGAALQGGAGATLGTDAATAVRFEVPDGSDAVAIESDCQFAQIAVADAEGHAVGGPLDLGASPGGDLIALPGGTYDLYVIGGKDCAVSATVTTVPEADRDGVTAVTLDSDEQLTGVRVAVEDDSILWVPEPAGVTVQLRCGESFGAVSSTDERFIGELAAGDDCLVLMRRATVDSEPGPIEFDLHVIGLEEAT